MKNVIIGKYNAVMAALTKSGISGHKNGKPVHPGRIAQDVETR